MTQLNPTDKFIVDRNGSTYKTTFADIENSIDHQYTVTLDQTEGGAITDALVQDGGDGFLENNTYTFNVLSGNTYFTIVPEADGPLTDGGYTITSNATGIAVNDIFTSDPYDQDGAVLDVVSITDGAPTDMEFGSYFDYPLIQDTIPDPDGDGDLYPSGAVVRVTGVGLGQDPTVKLIARGSSYYSGEATIERGSNTDFKVDITATDDTTTSIPTATIIVTGVSDGTDQDKAQFTIKVGTNEKTIKVTPGRGIAFENVYDEDTGDLLDDEIIIKNTLESGGGGGDGNTTSEPPVYVTPTPPSPPTYAVRNGALWYNLQDGRIYVAVTYVNSSDPDGFSYNWIDASPSSLNDAVRKTGDTMTGSLYIDNASLYTPHYQLELLPLIPDAP